MDNNTLKYKVIFNNAQTDDFITPVEPVPSSSSSLVSMTRTEFVDTFKN